MHSTQYASHARAVAFALVFVAAAAARAQQPWTASGGNIFNSNRGNVGIGTNAPQFKLHLNLTSNADGFAIGGVPTPGFMLLTTSPQPLARNWAFFSNYGTPGDLSIVRSTTNTTSAYGGPASLTLLGNGNVGIGVMAPTAMLHVGGSAEFDGSVVVDGNLASRYRDVAEWVPATVEMPPGTVVVLNPNGIDEVMPSHRPYDTRVAGVVSEKPGLILGEEGAGKAQIATTGRVKVRVEGPVEVGDLLVTSSRPGMAMKSVPVDVSGVAMHRPGTLLGKALQPLPRGEGEILVLLSLQ